MGMKLLNLEDEGIRTLMLDEINSDIAQNKLYMGKDLKPEYENVYTDLLKEAVSNGDSDSLADEIVDNSCLLEYKMTKSGPRKVPKDAHTKLAEGEFNRFYIRALCMKAIEDNFGLEVYRAKDVQNVRSTSQELIGQTVDPEQTLEDLRENIGKYTSSGIPGGPNSGLSLRKRD
ncbi:hypothetical protein [Methanobacterium petrolearium]|uniref:hypothetical protein n=1 Tax=Methanobacterium petrolearium TaxID=710190 RepID=UPI001AE39FD1|nr:hypothetical protein [Methanobacterium petrolearium]MBP1946322.1 hypothetical protein [Methanobacterium petrolearium]BDZ71421.1 hypothetical protein GCM10025861_19380 [Methanobacterium petrolearium]